MNIKGPLFHLIQSERTGNEHDQIIILKTASNSQVTSYQKPISTQTMALAALAILGHKSAHSFPMGPVMADPTSSKTTTISNIDHCRNITAKTWWTPIPSSDSHEGIINNNQVQADNKFQKKKSAYHLVIIPSSSIQPSWYTIWQPINPWKVNKQAYKKLQKHI